MSNPITTSFANPAVMPGFTNLSNLAPHGSSLSSINGAGAGKPCLFYFVHLDEFNHPIPGTMFAKNNNKIIGGCTKKIVRLTGQVMEPPAGYIQCFPENGLRYWYQVKSIPTGGGNARTQILPNSLIAVRGVPKGPAGRSCYYIEYKIFKQL